MIQRDRSVAGHRKKAERRWLMVWREPCPQKTRPTAAAPTTQGKKGGAHPFIGPLPRAPPPLGLLLAEETKKRKGQRQRKPDGRAPPAQRRQGREEPRPTGGRRCRPSSSALPLTPGASVKERFAPSNASGSSACIFWSVGCLAIVDRRTCVVRGREGGAERRRRDDERRRARREKRGRWWLRVGGAPFLGRSIP